MAPETTNNSGNKDKGSDANAGKPYGKRCNNNRNQNKNTGAKARKEPTFIRLHDTIKTVVADKPGLDPLSTQLKKLEDEVIAYAQSNMTAYVATSIRTLKSFNFKASNLMPTKTDPT